MKRSMLILGVLALMCAFASMALAGDFNGTWHVENDPQECIVIHQQGDSVKAEFEHGGTKTVDLVGYQKGSAIALSFMNSKGEIGAWMAVFRGNGKMEATCLNPDGSLRWKATYIRK